VADVGVFTSDADRLAGYCPDTTPVSTSGRAVWLADRPWLPAVPPGAWSGRLGGQWGRARWRHLGLSFALSLRRRDRAPLDAFLRAWGAAELLVVCGQGSMSDTTASHATIVLATLEMAHAAGLRTAMFGQGIGPLTDVALRRRVAAVLPRVDLLALREGAAGPGLLRELGAAGAHVVVTGDDAIELAFEAGTADRGSHVGLNIRLSENAGLGTGGGQIVMNAIQPFVERRQVGVVPVPIARGQAGDGRVLEQCLVGRGLEIHGRFELESPAAVIAQLGGCRILVTGAYHAAVFALSRGIPTVCLSSSEYYRLKFDGLAALFGPGCAHVRLDGAEAPARLSQAVAAAWSAAPPVRQQLRAAATRQITLGREAYRRLAASARTATGGTAAMTSAR
jgi:polysaccharide pyruvyl transferase WcaK-like protein